MQQNATDEFTSGKQAKATRKKSLLKVICIYKVFQNAGSNVKTKEKTAQTMIQKV